jgi:hypothetical protein
MIFTENTASESLPATRFAPSPELTEFQIQQAKRPKPSCVPAAASPSSSPRGCMEATPRFGAVMVQAGQSRLSPGLALEGWNPA